VSATAAPPPSTVSSISPHCSSEGTARLRIGDQLKLLVPTEHVPAFDPGGHAFLRIVDATRLAA
jgi:hypothetical protein